VSAIVSAENLHVGYHGGTVVSNIDLHVESGEVVALLGPNGAGKTTTILTLAGVLPPVSGNVHWAGGRGWLPLHQRARTGLALVTEERSVFMSMTTAQNLQVARCEISTALELFPELRPLMGRRAGLLSGGEQQILALARALARRPKVLFADELSLGLAPFVVARLLSAVRRAADDGVGCLIVEQNVNRILEIADRVYLLAHGELTYGGTAREARERFSDFEASYLAVKNSAAELASQRPVI
jgi:branched-chain amino acid transport system ATP-binding protein